MKPDGHRRDPFHNLNAQFFMDIVANLAVSYEEASGRGKKAVAADLPANGTGGASGPSKGASAGEGGPSF